MFLEGLVDGVYYALFSMCNMYAGIIARSIVPLCQIFFEACPEAARL